MINPNPNLNPNGEKPTLELETTGPTTEVTQWTEVQGAQPTEVAVTDHVAEAEEKDIPTNTTHARTTKQLLMVTHVQALNFQEEGGRVQRGPGGPPNSERH